MENHTSRGNIGEIAESDQHAAMTVVTAIVRNAEALRRRWAADGRIGVSEVRAISRLGEGDGLSPHDLGESMDLGSGAITGLLDRLQGDGLIRRVPHPRDRRRLVIELTEEGRGVAERWTAEYDGVMRDALVDTTPEERGAVVRFLSRLADGLREASVTEEG